MEPSRLQLAAEHHADGAVEQKELDYAAAPGLAALNAGDFWLENHLVNFCWQAGHWIAASHAGSSYTVHPW